MYSCSIFLFFNGALLEAEQGQPDDEDQGDDVDADYSAAEPPLQLWPVQGARRRHRHGHPEGLRDDDHQPGLCLAHPEVPEDEGDGGGPGGRDAPGAGVGEGGQPIITVAEEAAQPGREVRPGDGPAGGRRRRRLGREVEHHGGEGGGGRRGQGQHKPAELAPDLRLGRRVFGVRAAGVVDEAVRHHERPQDGAQPAAHNVGQLGDGGGRGPLRRGEPGGGDGGRRRHDGDAGQPVEDGAGVRQDGEYDGVGRHRVQTGACLS